MNKQELIERLEGLKNIFGNKCKYIEIDAVIKLASELDEPQPIKLKDVIARIKIFDVGTQKVWLNEILNELGSDYGTLKFKAGYEQGKVNSAMEREKVTIPQVAADWIKWTKAEGLDLQDAMNLIAGEENEKLLRWFYHESKQETFARAWLDGFEIEKEKRYTVVMEVTKQPLYYNAWDKKLFFSMGGLATKFTRKELEEAGFGWVFDCPGIEIEEVGG